MKTIIFIILLFFPRFNLSAQQDSVKLKSGATITKATYSEKVKGKIVKYKTVYLSRSTQRLFVIAYDRNKQKYYKKELPKNIKID